MQIALLDVGRQTGARPAALNVANDDRDLGHRRPTNRFGLERNPRASAARHSEIPAVRTSEGDRDRCQFVFGLDKNPAILWQLAPERFHHGRPRRDRVTGAEAHAARDQSVGQRLVPVHRDLRASARSWDVLEPIMLRENVAHGIRVTGLERHQRGVDHALVFAAEFFSDDSF